MSKTQTIDQQVDRITQAVLQGNPSRRELAIAIEANQAYADYLDWLKDNLTPEDLSVTVEVDGTRIRFENENDFADWLTELL